MRLPAGLEFTADQVCVLLAWAALMMKFCKNLAGPCPAPTYLPTYLPYLEREILENQQEITTRTVIWARQLVSPQPKLGPVP